jgi:formate hydrogenlyase subunit 6/NADH:ubiquinone oxidoreductase subunit I
MGFLKLSERLQVPTYDDPGELQSASLTFDESKCKRCGICISICPGACITSDTFSKMDYMAGTAKGKGGLPRLETTANGKVITCVGCYDCGAACPQGAISVQRGFRAGYRLKKLHQTPDFRYPKRY